MSFQPFLKLFNHPSTPLKKGRARTIYLFRAILLVILGSGLVWAWITTQGLLLQSDSSALNIPSDLPSNFSPSVLYWETDIRRWADQYDLDALLVATVMQIESCGNPAVSSPVGAQGLFQVMPFHFAADEDMLDPQTNALRGLDYLKMSYDLAEGDLGRTLAGYNGGHGQINRNPLLWPQETQDYVHWGLGIYEDAASGANPGSALSAWLNAGGYSLCQSAENELGME